MTRQIQLTLTILILSTAAFLLTKPPVPGPGPAPEPIGKAVILVAYEEGNVTDVFADLVVDFQNGQAGKPFKAKGHKVLCLDNDTPDISGGLTPPLRPWSPYDDSKPEVIVSSADKLLFRVPLTYSTTAEELSRTLTERGL